MKTNLMFVSLLAILVVVLAASFVSAAPNIINVKEVYIDGMEASRGGGITKISLAAGDTVPIKVRFLSLTDAEDVEISAWFSGHKSDKAVKELVDLRENRTYYPALALEVPSDVEPEEKLRLYVEIDSDAGSKELEYFVEVQRTPYNLEIVSVDVDNRVEAGEKAEVEVVVKNTGRHELDDVFALVRIPELGLEKTIWLSDLDETDECWDLYPGGCSDVDDDDWEDAKSGETTLKIPTDAEEGIYELEIIAYNDDSEVREVRNIVVASTGASEVYVLDASKTVSANEKAIYKLTIVNKGNEVKVYSLDVDGEGLSVDAPSIVVVEAGSSETVELSAVATEEGTYNLVVNVVSDDEIIGTANLSARVEGKSITNPVVVLSIVLAVIFVVLLIVLIVLLTKKPETEEELSESYY